MKARARDFCFARAAAVAAATLAAACTVAACKPEPARPEPVAPRLVLLYAPCTVNKFHLSPYDESVPYTPGLEAFAKESLVFDAHHTEAGQSGIAYASLFSGTQADVHGIFKHPRHVPQELTLIPEVFAAAGYEPFSWLVQGMASSKLSYGQGVPENNTYLDVHLEADDPRFRAVLDKLKADPEYKAFVITNFTVTHGPYKGHLLGEFCEEHPEHCPLPADHPDVAKFRQLNRQNQRLLSVEFATAVDELGLSEDDVATLRIVNEMLYKADIFRLDRMFGRIVAAVDDAGLADQSAIAFTSDHGEVLWRDNALLRWTHGYQMAPEVTGVSFLLRAQGAGIRAGRYPGVSRSIDVLATLAGAATVPPAGYTGDGVDLASVWRDRREVPDLTAFSHSALLYAPLRARHMPGLSKLFPAPDPEYMWIAARRGDFYHKLKRAPDGTWKQVVYDLSKDYGEENDLFDPSDAGQAEVFANMKVYKHNLMESAYTSVAGRVPREKAIRMLRSMGYID